MDLYLDNKIVLITGASRGIGLSTTEAFLNEGATVIIIAKNSIHLNEVSSSLRKKYGNSRVLSYAFDCSIQESWQDFILDIREKVSKIDIVIANVGNGKSVTKELLNADQFEYLWNINYTSAVNTIKAGLQMMNADGVFLLVSSIAGIEEVGAPLEYSLAKASIIKLTKSLSRSIPLGMRINCIAPGNIFVKDGTWDAKIKDAPLAVDEMIQNKVPLKRLGLPEEIADSIVFLCSKRSSFTTGACLVIDGGQTISIL
jgi:3-oxoacyl-[acyl-carrier protein] reductase